MQLNIIDQIVENHPACNCMLKVNKETPEQGAKRPKPAIKIPE